MRFRCPDSLVSCRKADSCKKSTRFQKYPDSSGRCLNICVTTISFLCIMFGFTIHTNTLLRFPIANYQLAMIYWNCSKNSIQVNRRLFSGCCPLFSLSNTVFKNIRFQSSTRIRQNRRIQKQKSTLESDLKKTRFRWPHSLVSCGRKADSCLKKYIRFQNNYYRDSCGRGLT